MPEWECLVRLAQPLSSVMGWGKRLYYSEQDIRAFLGGIAMNKLHILQGISGTGKTSFPIAFARALGRRRRENYKLVEVQAAWRDRRI
jgi:MoxR-like ATPase